MTIDERLDRLTERDESLSQSLKWLTRDVHEPTRGPDGIAANVRTGRRQDPGIRSKPRRQDAGNIRALARIAELHYERLERLESDR